ncbi:N-acetylmuramoyl-L-alanine amidase [Pedosphaera parvula]|uniref:N-acetylmuramoyl-L-alanine amidase n=1 Tax=Pedosphaera parvula (strain Ellin514) TaxID=320771 RepID=B9XEI5_PEDPL|nr:peptidoglycan recognition family protein [Pedosphaera parvula]EEF61699.1 N-acetylmuramyl-L-alanine amidase, negative regulator of AmpC, AmpD [Pedosphaera parvula Ellin514]
MIFHIRSEKRLTLLLKNAPLLMLAASLALATGCKTAPTPGAMAPRANDEIMVAGQRFHTGTKVVLWTDPGGYDAYRVERRFAPLEKSGWEASHEEVKELQSPNRYNTRRGTLTPEQIEEVRGGGWPLPMLQDVVDQFVLHFDVCGTSRQCFNILQDHRDLSVHFMLDVDGTIYQTLDLKERAWHATTSNNRSVGIEIANIGAYSNEEKSPLGEWYKQEKGRTRITIPESFGGDSALRTKGFVGYSARPEPVKGVIQGRELTQYDYTPEQYEALAHLTAALCKIFPKITCDYPKDTSGNLITHKLSDADLKNYHGVMGHYHVQTDKVDPGPALQWDRLITKAQKLRYAGFTKTVEDTSKGQSRSPFGAGN